MREGAVRDEGNKRLTFFFLRGGVPGTVSGGSSCVSIRHHIRAGAMGQLQAPKE